MTTGVFKLQRPVLVGDTHNIVVRNEKGDINFAFPMTAEWFMLFGSKRTIYVRAEYTPHSFKPFKVVGDRGW